MPRFGWTVTALLLAACAAESERVPDTEVYLLALASVREHLDHDGMIAIHPLLVLRPPAEPSDDRPAWEFNTADTASVAGILKAAGPGYRLCTPAPTGSCDAGEGGISIILSEATEFGANGVVLYALVTDGRAGRRPRMTFMIRLKHTIGGWSVVESRSRP